MNEKKFDLLVLPTVPNMQQVIDRFPFPIALTKGQFKNLEIVFQNGQVTATHKGVDLRDFSLVWLCSYWKSRDLAYAMRLYLKHNNTPSTNVEKSTSKLTDHMLFSLNGVTSPDTLFIGHSDIKKCLVQIQNVCGYPLIIKDTKGTRGAHVMKIESEEDLLVKAKDLPKHKKFLFQKYIHNKYDWGIMVANGTVVSGEKSYSCEGEFRNNACNGAKEVFVDPNDIPQIIKQMALDASKALGLSWSRSDIIIDEHTQKPYVLEVNRLPGITPKTSEVEGAYAFLSSQVAPLVG
ncbi:hypothetical protein KKC60_04890 [Patescibacteria group bacterium]|nr:hypothetical protein [Patescibacteria group bacterium]